MPKPTIIIDKWMFFFGLLGFVLIVFNLSRTFLSFKGGYDLFLGVLIFVFYTVFFGWLVEHNIRFSYVKDKITKMRKKRGKREQEKEFDGERENV